MQIQIATCSQSIYARKNCICYGLIFKNLNSKKHSNHSNIQAIVLWPFAKSRKKFPRLAMNFPRPSLSCVLESKKSTLIIKFASDPPPPILPHHEKQFLIQHQPAETSSVSKKHPKEQKQRIHDSWSSRASSIMAKGIPEPNYMSRTELIRQIAIDVTSDVPLGQYTREELEKLTQYIHESEDNANFDQENYEENSETETTASVNTVKNAEESIDLEHELYNASITSGESSCSCESCAESSEYSSCSCCQNHEEDEEYDPDFLSSMTSTSKETVVDQEISGRDKSNKQGSKKGFSNIYVVNGSQASEQLNNNYDPIPTKIKQKQLRKEQLNVQNQARYSTTPEDFQEMYEPVNAGEIRRQKNARVLKRYLREFASDWEARVNNLNTLRRGKVLKDLKKQLRQRIDLDNVRPEELGKQVEVALREALDSSYEAISNVNIGQMYVPMEENPNNSKVVSRENTDYDTFGSIDSLIFEPKIPSNEAILEVQEEIGQQFDFLDIESEAVKIPQAPPLPLKTNAEIIGPGKTTFAERVKLFQQMSNLDKTGETSWRKMALEKSSKSQKTSEPVSLCSQCNAPMLESFICSTCDGYSLENPEEAETLTSGQNQLTTSADVHVISSGTASWDYLEDKGPNNENDLRRMLKQSFGAQNDIEQRPKDQGETNLNIKHVYEPVVYSASDMEHNLEYEVDFLSEYARKKPLFEHSDSSGSNSKIALTLLDKSGNKVQLSEQNFRADIESTLKRLDKKRKNASPSHETNASDSGIASPPPGGETSILRAPSTNFNDTIDEEIDHENSDQNSESELTRTDSGMDDKTGRGQPGTGNVPKPRDTMIRELKSRLKQKFQEDSHEEILEEIQQKPQKKLVQTGTVESRKLEMNSKLGKVFAARHNPNKAPELPGKTLTNFAEMNKKRHNHDLPAEENTPNRETLYGPGGLFGPKGPFSTPHVRYPNGMELPPRKKTPFSRAASANLNRNLKTPNIYSEISSIAEDRSIKSHYVVNSVMSIETPQPPQSKPPSRMETYLQDWSELPTEDLEKWKEEKAKRMLAWIHTLQGNENIGTETPWWKVI